MEIKQIIILTLIGIFLIPLSTAIEFEKGLEEYNPESVYSEIYNDCIFCIKDNTDSTSDNASIMTYSVLRNKVKCWNYAEYTSTTVYLRLWPINAFNKEQCIPFIDEVEKEASITFIGSDLFYGTIESIDRGKLSGFLYGTVKGLANGVCLGGICGGYFFTVGEVSLTVFKFIFDIMWFLFSNIYLAIMIIECFILYNVIKAEGFGTKIKTFSDQNKGVILFLYQIFLGGVRLLISIINMLRGLIPVV